MGRQQHKLRVGLVYGGKSGEHEISLATAFAVIGALDYGKYEIVPFYIMKTGAWRVGESLYAPFHHKAELTLAGCAGRTVDAMQMLFASLERSDGTGKAGARHGGLDVMFPLLHGTNGEDGTIQGLFEMANLPYVGAGVLASSVGMDKAVMKQIFTYAGLPQCKYIHFIRADWEQHQAQLLARVEHELGYPCFVKPANLGASVGISKVRNGGELIRAIARALHYDRKIVIEEFIDAREVEVSVCGNDDAQTSVPGEIVSSNDFYDYEAKYIDGKSQMVIPAPFAEQLCDQLRELAVQAYRAIDGSGLARVDFFVRRTDMRIFINEVNTMPGFTPVSMYPLMWGETGLAYGELLDRLLQLALERFEAKQLLRYESVRVLV